jgi:hypothetical protein
VQRIASRNQRDAAGRSAGQTRRGAIVVLVVVLAGGLAGSAIAGDDWLQPDDWRHWLRGQEIGGRSREFGTIPPADADGPSDTGRRVKAGVLSLVLPGAGQFYNDQRGKGLVMLGVEAAIWGAYLGFHQHAGNLSTDYRNWAGIYADAHGDHPDSFWQAVGRFTDSDAWYESSLRQARAFGEPPPPPPPPDQQWQWRNNDFRVQYQDLRADANRAYDRRDQMILFALLNRAISVFDAVRNGGQPLDTAAGTTGATVLGIDLALQIDPDWTRPAARAVAGWSF